MSTTADRIIAIAKGEVGYHEGRDPSGNWNNQEKYSSEVPTLAWVSAGGFAWCAVFVCWAFNKAGALNLIPGGPTASVAHFRDAAKQAGDFSEYPAVGAIILFGKNGDAHTGIVETFDANTVTTIEGNTNTSGAAEGDGVYRKVHQRTDPWVYGYVYPQFTEGIVCADPTRKSGKPVPAGRSVAPAVPTRVSIGRAKILDGLSDLDAAVANGRRGTVRILVNLIRPLANRIPLG